MSILDPTATVQAPAFHGKGRSYFGVVLINVILTFVTLGIYYPWAKATRLKYLYENTEFEGGRFTFHGTGKEMFIGMLKALIAILLVLSVLYAGLIMHEPIVLFVGFFIYMIGFAIILPLALVGGLKYRLSRTSWKGIHMGYRGSVKSMLGICVKGMLLSIITFGIYSPWFLTSVYKELAKNIRFGSVHARFKGEGDDLFSIFLFGYILTILTLGIYIFWWMAKRYNFIFNNIELESNGEKAHLKSKVTGGQLIGLYLVNFLLLISTLGIAYPWVKMRIIRFFVSRLEITSFIDFNEVQQTEEDYGDATGASFLDAIDLQLI